MISESQERMVAVVAPDGSRRSRRSARAGSSPCTAIGEVTDTRRAARALRRRGRRRDPGRAPDRRVPALRGRARAAAARAGARRSRPRASAARAARLAERRSRVVYGRYDHLVGSRTVRRPGLDAAVLRLRPSLRGLARLARRAAAGSARSTRAPAARSPCSRRRATSRAPAASRSALTDCLNFGNPEKPRDRAGSSPRRSRAWRSPARRSASRSSPATSRSTTRPTGARSTRRPWSAASGSSPTSAACRARWRRGRRRSTSRTASPVSLAGSETQARWGEVGGSPAELDLEAEAALIRLLWRAAPRVLARARRRRGRPRCRARRGGDRTRASVPSSSSTRTTRRALRRGRRPGDPRRRAELPGAAGAGSATVGGNAILGSEVTALRAAWEALA